VPPQKPARPGRSRTVDALVDGFQDKPKATPSIAEEICGPAPSTRSSEVRDARVGRFLDHVAGIRIGVQSASGFGHQSAAVAALEQVRDLGYDGPIQVVYDGGAASKLPKVLPGFLERGGPVQRLELDGKPVVCVHQEYFAKHPPKPDAGLLIGLVGACDRDGTGWLDKLSVDSAVVLQPFDWGTEEDRTIEVRGRRSEPLMLPSSSTYIYDVAGVDGLGGRRAAIQAFVAHQARLDPSFRDRAPAMTAMLQGVQSGGLDLMPVYGLHQSGFHSDEIDPRVSLNNLIGGVRHAQRAEGAAAKPAVLCVIGDVDDALPPLDPKIKAIRADAPDAAKMIAELRADETLVLYAGRLPQGVFRQSCKLATLPTIMEGANTANLMQMLGKPYLSVKIATTDFPEPLGAQDRGKAGAKDASQAIGQSYGHVQRSAEQGAMAMMMLSRLMQTDAMPSAAKAGFRQLLRDPQPIPSATRAQLAEHAIAPALAEIQPTMDAEDTELMALQMMPVISGLFDVLQDVPPQGRLQLAGYFAEEMAPEDARRVAEGLGAVIGQRAYAANSAILGDTILAAKDPDSLVSQYFWSIGREARAPRNDQLSNGLDRLRRRTGGTAWAEGSPTSGKAMAGGRAKTTSASRAKASPSSAKTISEGGAKTTSEGGAKTTSEGGAKTTSEGGAKTTSEGGAKTTSASRAKTTTTTSTRRHAIAPGDLPGRMLGALGATFEARIDDAERDGLPRANADRLRRDLTTALDPLILSSIRAIERNPDHADAIMRDAMAAAQRGLARLAARHSLHD